MTPTGKRAAILYLRPGCPLCFVLKRSALRAARRHRLPLRIVDIRGSADLLALYDRDVPVLLFPDGAPRLQGRVPAEAVEAAFRQAARRPATAEEGPAPRRHGRFARLLDRLRGPARRHGA